jgi:branched-chain amino acid transport system ATP-binding protein
LARTFQHPELFSGLTVRQHLTLAYRVRHAKGRVWSDLVTLGSVHRVGAEETARIDELVGLLSLERIADQPALGLPLGSARLVELGRALATSPTVLLLDEPSSGLDSAETEQFEGTLRRVAAERGVSVLLVEHDVELVMRVCAQVYVLDFGAMIADGTPAAVRANPAVRAAYLGEEVSAADGGGPDDVAVAVTAEAAPAGDLAGLAPAGDLAGLAPAGDLAGLAPAGDLAEPDLAEPDLAELAPAGDLAGLGPAGSAAGVGPAGAAGAGSGGRSAALVVKDLSVRYGDAVALSGVSFSVGSGQVLAVLGPNGAGKSSLARAVSGLVCPHHGSVVFDGVEMSGWPAHRIRHAGCVHLPEGRGVFRALTVLDNLRMAAGSVSGRQARKQSVELALATFPALASRRRQMAGSLSGGEQQMLSLARALATSPKLIIADEMSLGLAPKMVDLVFEGLARARDAGVSVIMIEQYVHRALAFADHCLVLQRGTLAWSGPASAAQSEVLSRYLGDAMTAAS